MKKNEINARLHVEMEFTQKVDMTEFLEKALKVSEIKEARKKYIESKLPDKELTNKIVLNAKQELEKLGFKTCRILSYANEQTIEFELLDFLKSEALKGLSDGKKSE